MGGVYKVRRVHDFREVFHYGTAFTQPKIPMKRRFAKMDFADNADQVNQLLIKQDLSPLTG
jgi:hypothetical protein